MSETAEFNDIDKMHIKQKLTPQEYIEPEIVSEIKNEKEAEKYTYEGIDFDTHSGAEMNAYESKGTYQDRITIFNWTDPSGKTKKLPVPQRWHPSGVIRRIIGHNKRANFTGITMIGASGSGKTTLTNKIIHHIHAMGEQYIVQRFNGRDMLDLDQHIKDMEVGKPHLIVFDDASYTMEDAKNSEIAKLANALTTIRHQVKSRVIMIINFHYSRATKKFFRNQHFTFLTSVSVEEMSNLNEMYKDKMSVIRVFAKQYNRMMLRGFFDCATSSFNRQILRYKTNDPFRLCLVAEIADLHFMVYDRDECNHCLPKGGDKRKRKLPKTIDETAVHMLHAFNPAAARNVLAHFASMMTGKALMKPYHQEVWNFLTALSREAGGNYPWEELIGKLDDARTGRKHLPKRNRDTVIKRNLSVSAIARVIAKEEAEEAKKGPITEGKDYRYNKEAKESPFSANGRTKKNYNKDIYLTELEAQREDLAKEKEEAKKVESEKNSEKGNKDPQYPDYDSYFTPSESHGDIGTHNDQLKRLREKDD
jgi:guanylate kinase|tara:strand:+ start:40364 stop:41965 length:1602 start_codon:yes stop_codon:yes gene_type:complete